MRKNDPKNAKQMISDLMDAITYAADKAAEKGPNEVAEVQKILNAVIDILIDMTTSAMALQEDIHSKMTELAIAHGKKLRGES
jgi:hypothetical protein